MVTFLFSKHAVLTCKGYMLQPFSVATCYTPTHRNAKSTLQEPSLKLHYTRSTQKLQCNNGLCRYRIQDHYSKYMTFITILNRYYARTALTFYSSSFRSLAQLSYFPTKHLSEFILQELDEVALAFLLLCIQLGSFSLLLPT